MTLKENLKNRRLELNLTLEDIAKKLSISTPTLHRYESGVISNIPFNTVEQLASILEITPAALMGWETNILNDIDQSFISKYNLLDDTGKHTVNTILQMEINRCK